MASATSDADEIRLQMAQIRRELHSDVRDVVATAEAVTDWRRYIRMYPWAAVGAALAVGYFVVPRRHKVVVAPLPVETAAEVQEAIAENGKPERKGLIGSAIGFLSPIAVRAAQGYAAQYLESWLEQQQQASTPPRPPAPGAAMWTGGARPQPPRDPDRV